MKKESDRWLLRGTRPTNTQKENAAMIFSEARLQTVLQTLAPQEKVQWEIFDNLPSTNLYLKELGRKGASEGTVVLAASQSAGRGRMGRSFYSPMGSGLYMSLLLRPKIQVDRLPYLTPMTAVAVAHALEALHSEPVQIKWVNDIYIRQKKVCGILVEGSLSGAPLKDFAVVGIGVNLYAPSEGFPPDIREKAGAVFDAPAACAEDVAAHILAAFFALYRALPQRAFMEEYRTRSFLTGKQVCMESGGQSIRGLVTGIDEEGRLLVLDEAGHCRTFSDGEATVPSWERI